MSPRAIQAPIFHVNGDDPEAVVHVARIATEYRQQFKKDVVVDMFCYRRHGHNEGDEPAFTQPLMYQAIAAHPTTREIYAQRLAEEGIVAAADADKMVGDFQAHLDSQFEAAKSYRPNKADWLEGAWTGLAVASGDDRRGETAVADRNCCTKSAPRLPTCRRIFTSTARSRARSSRSARRLNRATASIGRPPRRWPSARCCAEGTFVRLSGQDSGRGTFSQRHAVLVDQENETKYIPLQHVRDGQAPFEVLDSPLSEAAVLGFEYGYSLAEPHALILWEAQFGDFANGAQVVIDQFISSGEAKWLRMSGLTLAAAARL